MNARDGGGHSPTRAGRVDEACDRFEAAWKAGRCPRIEDDLAGADARERPALLRELLALELELRHRRGERPGPTEYRARFPADGAAIVEAFESLDVPPPPGAAPAIDVGRNLLFGLLALQNNFVGRDALVAAFSAWFADKSRPIGGILLDRGDLDPARHALIGALADQHLSLHGGDPDRSLAALGRVARDLDATTDTDLHASLAHLAEATGPFPPPTIGSGERYRVLRPHARGGLGEVFVAEDAELHREVALKEIQPRHAHDPASRARFVLEAEITGNLEHPGIVPVYGLGTYGDGRPYYAMRLIRGESLKEAIERFHRAGSGQDDGERTLAFRGLIGRFVAACNAVAYAHSRGVLHRDIKPGNIMLGPFGETLLVDWGLAKPIGRADKADTPGEATLRPPSAGGSTPTLTGAAVGTPAYMSPEQAEGDPDRLGPASDVYSLGATLYHLLAGRAPFGGDDVGAILRRVRAGEFPTPRQVGHAVDPALEAVCLKAMATRPEDRYASPRDLADEIERWLADEPVGAYREPAPVRLARWGRRHRTTLAGVAAALVVAIAALAVGTVLIGRRRAEAVEQRDLARANLDRARQVVDEMYTEVAARLAEEDGLDSYRREILEKALRFYEGVALPQSRDPAVRFEAGRTAFRAAEIRAKLGRSKDAESAYLRAGEILAALVAEHPDRPEYAQALAGDLNSLSIVYADTGRRAEAEATYLEAAKIRARLSAADPKEPAYRAGLARVFNSLGVLYHDAGRLDEAEAALRRAEELDRALMTDHPEEASYRHHAAMVGLNRGNLHATRKQTEAAESSYERALALETAALRDRPRVAESRATLGRLRYGLGNVARDRRRPAEQEAEYRRAEEIFRDLARGHPEIPEYQRLHVRVLADLGFLQLGPRPREAEATFARVVAILDGLTAAHPDRSDIVDLLGTARLTLGLLADGRGEHAAARDQLDRAIPVLEGLHRRDAANPTPRARLRDAHWSRGRALLSLGHPAEAVLDYERALELNHEGPSGEGQIRPGLSLALLKSGRIDRATASAEALAALAPRRGVSLYDAACIFALASAAVANDAGRGADAERLAARGVGLLREAAASGYFRNLREYLHLKMDADLVALRPRRDYRLLELDLAFPADPFAR